MANVWASAKILEFDFAGIEAQILGWFMRKPSYIRLGALGVHAYLASHVLKRPADLAWADADLRRYFSDIKHSPDPEVQRIYKGAKKVVHGNGYGQTPDGVFLNNRGLFATKKAAQAIFDTFYQVCPDLPEFHTAVRHTAHLHHKLGGPPPYLYDPHPAQFEAPRTIGHPYGYVHHFHSVIAYERLTEAQRLWRVKRKLPMSDINGIWWGIKLGEDANRCVPPDYRVWMGDFTYKPIGDVRTGDTVIGWTRRMSPAVPSRGTANTKYMQRHKRFNTDTLTRATVLSTAHTVDYTLTIHLASGKTLRCTRDHRWLGTYRNTYQYLRADELQVGNHLCRVDVTDPGDCPRTLRDAALWLAGFYDGEGSHRGVTQADDNYGLLDKAQEAFTSLGFEVTRQPYARSETHWKPTSYIGWNGGRQAALRFVRFVPSQRFRRQWADRMILSSRFRWVDRVVKIERNPLMEPVVCIKTTTGNFIVEDTCSHNSVAFYPQSTARGVLTEACFPLFDPDDDPALYIGDAYFGRTPLRAPIHDSLLLEVPTRKVDRVIERVQQAMGRPVEALPCPPEWGMGPYLTIGVDGKIGDDWGHMATIPASTVEPSDMEPGPVEWTAEEADELAELATEVSG